MSLFKTFDFDHELFNGNDRCRFTSRDALRREVDVLISLACVYANAAVFS